MLDRVTVPSAVSERHEVTFCGLAVLMDELEEPIAREVIEWFVDRLDTFFEAELGPSPRRRTLYRTIGNLVDRRCLSVSFRGYSLTPAGRERFQKLCANDHEASDSLRREVRRL